MYLQNDPTLSDKLNMISVTLERPDLLANESEGSKVIILTVLPKEENSAVRNLTQRFSNNAATLDCAKILTETVQGYGLSNLEEDFLFCGRACFNDFSSRFLSQLTDAIVGSSKGASLTVVCRLGILNGFFSLNPLIEALTGRLANPVIMIYPGRREDRVLKFLDGRRTASVYRAVII
ncbi:MAG TPA: DUF1788 domain-containing protein [Thermotogota bacterium]|nr:DUF1788 domain-containing protein [Thermotogota bacterium]